MFVTEVTMLIKCAPMNALSNPLLQSCHLAAELRRTPRANETYPFNDVTNVSSDICNLCILQY
jgi:hypothetical protein